MRLIRLALLTAALATAPHAAAQIATIADGSGSVTANGASQVVFQQNVNRSYLECQNPVAATEILTINIGAPASLTGSSYELAPGGSIRFSTGNTPVPTGTIAVTAATAGHRFICKQG